MPVYATTTGTSIKVDDFDVSFTVKVATAYVEVAPVFVVASSGGGGEPDDGWDSGFGPGFGGGSFSSAFSKQIGTMP